MRDLWRFTLKQLAVRGAGPMITAVAQVLRMLETHAGADEPLSAVFRKEVRSAKDHEQAARIVYRWAAEHLPEMFGTSGDNVEAVVAALPRRDAPLELASPATLTAAEAAALGLSHDPGRRGLGFFSDLRCYPSDMTFGGHSVEKLQRPTKP